MGYRKKMIWVPVLLMMLLCVLPAVQAKAAEADGLWLRTTAADGGVTASICVNTTVADGLVELRYDSSVLTFTEVVVDSRYVAAHAVNAEEAGVVKIAWVAPGDYAQDGTVHILMQVCFTGASADSLTLTGTVHTPEAAEIGVIALDLAQLEAAIAAAEGYSAEDYTHESFAVLADALTQAKAVLHSELTAQADVDAAVTQLNAAVNGLELPPVVIPTEPTQPETQPTQPAPTEPTQPATQPVEPTPDPQPGNGLWIGIVVAVVVAGVAVAVIMKKKKEARK